MNINLQIEQILLENIDLSYGECLNLQAAVEAELSRLLTTNGLPTHLENGGAILKIPANITLSENSNPTHMGQSIAQSIYQNISGQNMDGQGMSGNIR